MHMLLFSLILLISLPTIAANPAPPFDLPTANGTITLSALKGKTVYLDFWASWCIPCRKSFPWMNEIHDKYQDQGLVVIGVNLDKNRTLANQFLAKYTAKFDIAFDPEGHSADAYNVQGMPSSYLIDKNGNIIMTHLGFLKKDQMRLETSIKNALN